MKKSEQETTESIAPVSLQAFVQGATHEIANPLSSISMGAEVAKLMLERNRIAEARELVERILADCARCTLLLQGLRRFAEGLQSQPAEAVEAKEFAQAVVGTFRTEERGAAPRVHIETHEAAIMAMNRPALEHACVDLLRNATDAGAQNIEIAIRREGPFVIFVVSDDGEGLTSEAVAKAFDAFFSTHRAAGRSGLGLTLLRELARLQGGDLSIRANALRGSVAELRLPSATAR